VPDLDSALAALKGGGYIWLIYLDPSREELSSLIKPLGIHPLAIEDCLDDEQIPKIEDYPTNTFILFNKFFYDTSVISQKIEGDSNFEQLHSKELFIDELDLFIGKNFLVLVSHNIHGDASFMDRLEQMAGLDRENVLLGPDYLLHVIMDYIVDQKFHTIEALQEELDVIEENIITTISTFRPEELMRLRRFLLSLRKSITHEREILVKICRKDSPFITEKSIYHFRDIYDHLAKFFEETEIYRDMISALMEMYLSMTNNRMALLANRTNLVVRRLTLITTIFMPLTLLAGIGGMSEWTMMTGAENWRISYPVFLIIMMIIGVINYFVLKKILSGDEDIEE